VDESTYVLTHFRRFFDSFGCVCAGRARLLSSIVVHLPGWPDVAYFLDVEANYVPSRKNCFCCPVEACVRCLLFVRLFQCIALMRPDPVLQRWFAY